MMPRISHTAYRGVEYDQRCVESKESHGTYAIVVAPILSDRHANTNYCRTNVPWLCSIHWITLR